MTNMMTSDDTQVLMKNSTDQNVLTDATDVKDTQIPVTTDQTSGSKDNQNMTDNTQVLMTDETHQTDLDESVLTDEIELILMTGRKCAKFIVDYLQSTM